MIRAAILFFLASAVSVSAADKRQLIFEPLAGSEPVETCQVHVQEEPGGAEEVYDCGAPIQFENETQLVWLSGEGTVSPFAVPISSISSQTTKLYLPLRKAGMVTIGQPSASAAVDYTEIWYFDHSRTTNLRTAPLIRRVSPTTAIAIPAGGPATAIALQYHQGRVVALSTPFRAQHESSTSVLPLAPQRGSDVFLYFTWPDPVDSDWGQPIPFSITTPDKAVSPSAVFQSDGLGLAVWYGLEPNDATIELASPHWYMEPLAVPLRAGAVSSETTFLMDRVAVDVSTEIPSRLELPDTPAAELSVRQLGEKGPLRKVALHLGEVTKVDKLPPTLLDFVLTIDGAEVFQRVDLRRDPVENVHFELDPITVHGKVYVGREPARATVEFGKQRVSTDEAGLYEAVLWQPRLYIVRAQTIDTDERRFERPIRISGDRELDITIPDNRYSVRTLSEENTPLEGADVTVRNEYIDTYSSSPEPSTRPSGSISRAITDADGIAHLPPLNPGTATIVAAAEGYESRTIEQLPIPEEFAEQIIEIVLSPEESTKPLRISLPNGSPAAAARIAALPGEDQPPTWVGTAGQDGVVHLPANIRDALLVISHSDAGMLVRRWSTNTDHSTPWELPMSAPTVDLLTVHADGTPAGQSKIVLWINGFRFGSALPFGPVLQSDSAGHWSTKNLPRTGFRVVAFSPGSSVPWQSASISSLAEEIRFPIIDRMIPVIE